MMNVASDNTVANLGSLLGDDRPAGTQAKRYSRQIAADMVGFLDAAAVVAGGTIPAIIYAYAGDLPIAWTKHLQMCLVTALVVYGCMRHFGMYDTARMHDFPLHPGRLAGALAITFLAILGLGLPFAPKELHMWIWYASWFATSFVLLFDLRYMVRVVLRRMTKAGVFDSSVAVYGSGTVARRVENYLRDRDLGIRFAGVFDDRRDETRIAADGPELVGQLDDLEAAARKGLVDQIIIALPQAADQRTTMIARRLEHLPVSLHVVTHLASDLVEAGAIHRVSNLGTVGLIDVKSKPLADWSRVVKSAEDYSLGALFLVLALPLMALIALAIRLDSPGPVLFRQRRRGLNHSVFDVLKFRTMHVMENDGDVRQAVPNDPRVTRVGRILRRLSLDELPQLFNVLKGEMSLVGPRPHALAHDDHFGETVARYFNRQQVKPGITGLAQVSGFRGQTETPDKIERRLELDLHYVNSWSLWLDMKILARTVLCAATNENAY